ncbi:MAG: hypothetical protein J6A37_02225 [Oscillospiraceae bacterium]|nr:hypothetical protein [Oscillospiraceae bacterium]
MKIKAAAALTAAVMLTACTPSDKKAEETDFIETTFVSESQSAVSVYESKTETSEITITETEAAESEVSEKPIITDERTAPESVSYKFKKAIDINAHRGEFFFTGETVYSGEDVLICYFLPDPNFSSDNAKISRIEGISLADGTTQFNLSFERDRRITFAEGLTNGRKTALAEVYDSKKESYELFEFTGKRAVSDSIALSDAEYSWDVRSVKNTDGSVTDADYGSVLCERVTGTDPYGVDSKHMRFAMPYDHNSFIYQITGYEWAEGVGIYDYQSDSCTVLPDSKDTMPIGIHNGRIYTADCFDGVGTKIYTYELGVLKKELFCDLKEIFSLDTNDMVYYTMSDNGEFIAAQYEPYYESGKADRLVLISPDSGKVICEYEMPSEFEITNYYQPFFTEKYICLNDAQNDIIYTAPLPKGRFEITDSGSSADITYTCADRSVTLRSYDNSVTWNPKGFIISDFTDIMGCSGSVITEIAATGVFSHNYYLADICGEPVCIAVSFGFGRDGDNGCIFEPADRDTVTDIDGDGITELISNCVYGGDGVHESRIYRMSGGVPQLASGHSLIPEKMLQAQTMAGNVYSEYDPETNKMICKYVENEEVVTKEYEPDISALDFYEFESDYFDE